MIYIHIFFSICVWFMFGEIAAYTLIGNTTVYYPISIFGPFNVYQKYSNKEYARKINSRWKFFLRLGGCISLILMLIYYVIVGIDKFIKHIIWMFS